MSIMPVNNEATDFLLIYIPETKSTNSLLKEYLQQQTLEEFTTIYTFFQTSGRGQAGNSWESEKGKNLLFSIYCKPDFVDASQQFVLSQIVSLAIKKCLDRYTTDIAIKWPNDIYWKDLKICGILIENSLQEACITQSIIGIGLNINQTQFRSDAPNPVSLKNITGREHDLLLILNDILNHLSRYYADLKGGNREAIEIEYKKSLFRNHDYYLFNDGNRDFLARIYDVLPDGQLVLELQNGELCSFYFKQIGYVL